MKNISDALVYATTFISLCMNDFGDEFSDLAEGALGTISGYLNEATEEEKDSLAEAVERLLAQEKANAPRPEFVQDYMRWMQDMFGDDWQNNKRA